MALKISKNIVLIGMRGTGKSAVGKTLAHYLEWDFVDVDRELEAGESTTVTELIKKHDWEHFRNLESKYTAEIAERKNTIIATGGGVILREENVKVLKKNGVIVLLHSPLEHMAKRISKNDKRPSLTGEDPVKELENVWKERKELYEKAADVIVNFDFQTSRKKSDLMRKSKMVLKAVKNSV